MIYWKMVLQASTVFRAILSLRIHDVIMDIEMIIIETYGI